MERDSRINQLIREKEDLQVQLWKAERDLKLEESKTLGAHRLIGLLEEHVRNPGDLVIKARIYDEAVAKIGGVTALKLIHICEDYSIKMETILAEMRVIFDNWNRFFWGSPVPLEKVPDLTEFPDLPPTKVLQNLQTPTTLRTNQVSAESGERPVPGSDARTSKAERPQQEAPTLVLELAPTLEAQDPISMDTSEMPPLPVDPAPVVPSPPTTSPTPANPRPKIPFSVPVPPLSETVREYMESVRRQAAFTHTPGFQELLNQSQESLRLHHNGACSDIRRRPSKPYLHRKDPHCHLNSLPFRRLEERPQLHNSHDWSRLQQMNLPQDGRQSRRQHRLSWRSQKMIP